MAWMWSGSKICVYMLVKAIKVDGKFLEWNKITGLFQKHQRNWMAGEEWWKVRWRPRDTRVNITQDILDQCTDFGFDCEMGSHWYWVDFAYMLKEFLYCDVVDSLNGKGDSRNTMLESIWWWMLDGVRVTVLDAETSNCSLHKF